MIYMVDPIVKFFGLNFNENNDHLFWVVVIRLLLALITGGLLGAERAKKHHVAGLRTYVLVSLGACVAMLTNIFLNEGNGGDGARLGAAVITGIGFLGAGSMMITSRNQVKGLTTSAALWCVGTIGLAIGIGFYTVAIVVTILIMLVLQFMPKIEGVIQKRSRSFNIHVELISRPDLNKLIEVLRENKLSVTAVTYDPAYANSGLSVYSISLWSKEKVNGKYLLLEDINKIISELDYVHYVEFVD